MSGESTELAPLIKPVVPKTTGKQFLAVFLLTVAFAFARTAATIQLLSTPLAAKTFLRAHGENEGLSAVPLSFLFFGAAFMAPVASHFMAKVGRQKGLITGCFSGIIGSGICIIAQVFHKQWYPVWLPYTLICVGSLFLGVANGFVNFFRFAAADIVPHKRSVAISAVLFGGDAAALAGPSAAVWLENKLWHFGASYMSLSALFICTIIVLLYVEIPPMVKPSDVAADPPRPLYKLLQIPRLSLALATATISFGVMALVMTLLPLVMTEQNFSLDLISHVLQIHSIGMFGPGFVVGFIIEKFGCLIVDFLGLLFLIGANLTLIFGSEYWNFLVGMLFLGIGWNLSFISSTALLTTCYLPSEKATTQGVNDFVMYLIVSILSLTGGWLWKALGSWAYLNFFALALCLLGVLFILLVALGERCSKKPSRRQSSVN